MTTHLNHTRKHSHPDKGDQRNNNPKMEVAETPTFLPSSVRPLAYEDLLEEIVRQIAPRAFVIQMEDPDCLRFEITAPKDDHGRIIGKQGSIIGALHKVFTAIARGKPVKIDLREDVDRTATEGD